MDTHLPAPVMTITFGIMSGAPFRTLTLTELNPTVTTALTVADISPSEYGDYEVRVNGQIAPLDMQLENGDKIFLVKRIQGN